MPLGSALLPLLDSGSDGGWQPGDQEAIRQSQVLPATVPCLEAISRAMADLERHHLEGVLIARALLAAIALIDQQLRAAGPGQLVEFSSWRSVANPPQCPGCSPPLR
jgi:hypothetical protein